MMKPGLRLDGCIVLLMTKASALAERVPSLPNSCRRPIMVCCGTKHRTAIVPSDNATTVVPAHAATI